MKHTWISILALVLACGACVCVQGLGAPAIPLVDDRPILDGDLNDACWSNALHIADFTEPASARATDFPTEARLCFTSKALHLVLICRGGGATNAMDALVASNAWQSDAVEILIRSTDNITEHDRFVVQAPAKRSLVRQRSSNTNNLPAVPTWQASGVVVSNSWVAEISIPFSDLGLVTTPCAGEPVEVKLARKGLTNAVVAIWPSGAAYSADDDYQAAYFERQNILRNPDLALMTPDGVPDYWELSGDIQTNAGSGARVVDLNATNQACRMEQSIKLPAGQICRLSAEFRGSIDGRLRAKGPAGELQMAEFGPSAYWVRREISFIPPTAGRWNVIVDTTESGIQGRLAMRRLMLDREPTMDTLGCAIAVPVDTGSPYAVQHIPVADCQAVRGFFAAPIDGTTDSLDYSGQRWEYNFQGQQANAGVRYLYRHNDGLHVTLRDRAGVDAIQLFGGVYADVVTDCRQYDDESSGRKLLTFPGKANNSLAYLNRRAMSDRFSFFNVRDGYIADLYFFRCGGGVDAFGTAESAPLTATADVQALGPYFEQRFGDEQRAAWAAFQGTNAPIASLALSKGKAVHILAGPWNEDVNLTAIGLQGVIGGVRGAIPVTVQVQDFLHPRMAVTTARLELAGPGRLDFALAIPNQIVPKHKLVWVTLIPHKDFNLSSPQFVRYTTTREQALPGALAYRLTKLKGFWQLMSEERPWFTLNRNIDVDAWLNGMKDTFTRERAAEIRNAIDYCYWLKQDDPTVVQYHDWFYHWRYRGKFYPVLPPAQLPLDAGAPEWAVVARTAWLEARSVASWWVENRLAASGEFGGSDDDGSLYQNFSNFPMFEADGVGGALKAGAAHRVELDQAARLYQGLGRTTEDPLHFYEDGLNQESLVTWWNYGDPVYIERCMLTAKNLEALTMVNAAGHRHFKGDSVGSEYLHNPNQPITFDNGFQAQMVHPACELALYNRNPRAVKFLRELADAWLDHLAKAAPGEYPMAVDVASDKVIETGDEPFASGFGCPVSMMAFLCRVTGERKYLQPLVDFYGTGRNPEYSADYLPDLYQLGYLDGNPATIQKQFKNSSALEWLATGNKAPFLTDLKADLAEIQTFQHIYTGAEPFTDRVFLYASINPARAYSGGYSFRNKSYHSHAVSWEGFCTNYAALVRAGRPDRFNATLYNFSEEPLTGSMRFWTLDHGRYALTIGVDTNGDDQTDGDIVTNEIEVIRGDRLPINLAPRQVTVVTLTQKTKLDAVEARADLAVSPRELAEADGGVSGVVHNIGSLQVADVVVELVDGQGKVRQTETLGQLPAPLDLEPKRLPFRLTGLPASHSGWRVVTYPLGRQPEITQVNNSAFLP